MPEGHNLSQRAAAQIAQGLRDVGRLKRQLITPHRARWHNGTQANAATSNAGSGNCGCAVVEPVVDAIVASVFGTQKSALRWQISGIVDRLADLGCDLTSAVVKHHSATQTWYILTTRTCGSATDEYIIEYQQDATWRWELLVQLAAGRGSGINCSTEIDWHYVADGAARWDRTQDLAIGNETKYARDGNYEDPPTACVICADPYRGYLQCSAAIDIPELITVMFDGTDSGSPASFPITYQCCSSSGGSCRYGKTSYGSSCGTPFFDWCGSGTAFYDGIEMDNNTVGSPTYIQEARLIIADPGAGLSISYTKTFASQAEWEQAKADGFFTINVPGTATKTCGTKVINFGPYSALKFVFS